jgi:hypothetical protein
VTLAGDGFPSVVRCEGAPRDLGLDQGEACAAALCLLPNAPHRPAAPRPLERDLRRHFPQLAERLEGVARGARLPARILLGALARELGSLPQREYPATRAAALWGFAETGTGGGATLAWAARGVDLPWRVRQSRPENGLASLEIVLPWLPGGIAGLNAAGLAVACTTLDSPLTPQLCAAPAFLLVQECLQRFESVEGAEEWCLHRPAGGRATILIADAAGGLVGVEVAGAERERLLAQNGILASPDAPVHPPQIAAKAMATPGLDRAARFALLLQHARAEAFVSFSPSAEPSAAAVALDARERRLWVVGGQEPLRALDVAPRPL